MEIKKYILPLIGFILLTAFTIGNIFPTKDIIGNKKIAYNVKITETLICDTLQITETLFSEFEIEYLFKDFNSILNEPDDTIISNYVNPPYKMSKTGEDFIKKFENLSLDRYLLKGEKLYTIGYGHQILPEEKIGKHISKKKADELFKKDTEWVNEAVNRLINNLNPKFKVTQGFVDGMCSLIYNCGERGVEISPFYQRLKKCRFNNGIINKKDYEYALTGIKISRISKKYKNGHLKRRKAEYELAKK